jgi:DNA polymerase-3 subunit gamma/tau
MENFVVSARKYRPQTFSEVVGQDHIVTTLKNAIRQNQLAHSFLFCGPRGVGKTTCARILARTINCENPTADAEACNECASCKSFNDNASFSIHELDAASNNSVDDIRALIDQVRFMPAGKYKIYIIDEVHMLSAAAFNAFLKTLEEPPSYAIFILATTEKHKILPTILSRCQIFDFKRIRISDLIGQLAKICEQENIPFEPEALRQIAAKCEGAMRDALSMLDKLVSFSNNNLTYAQVIEHLSILDYDYFFRITDCMMTSDAASAMLLLDEVFQKGFEGDDFLVGLCEHFRNLLVVKDPATAGLLEASDRVQQRYIEQAQLVPTGMLLTALHQATQAELQFRSSKNKRLMVELAMLRLCHIPFAVAPVAVVVPESKKNTEPRPLSKVAEPVAESLSAAATTHTQPKTDAAAPPATEKLATVSLDSISEIEKQARASQQAASLDKLITAQKEITGAIAPELFRQAWEKYVNHLKSEVKKSLEPLYQTLKYELEGNLLRLHTGNNMSREQLENDKYKLQEFLTAELQQPLRIEIVVTEGEKTDSAAYTSKQKFEKMSRKNPNLSDLKNKLELDLDY